MGQRGAGDHDSLAALLEEWRSAERRLGSMGQDDPGRPQAEAEVDACRDAYQAAQRSSSSDLMSSSLTSSLG
ncbi:MAG TPA: hypothetical protein VM344_11195 [Vitreimonas sp.]|nr:hypothetical protein [Vitreimonas sp.]